MAAPVVANKGTKNEKAAAGSGTPTSVISFTTDGGKAVVVTVAIRRGGTISIGTPTLVDNMGNTYTYIGKSENATGAAGSAVMIFYCNRARGLYTGASTFTLTTASAFTALSLRVFELDVPAVAVTSPSLAAANGSSTAPSVTSGTPPNTNDRLWIGSHATLNPNTTTDTISSTGYTLSPVTTSMEGTSGSTAASNVATKLGYKGITGSSTTQPFVGTLGTTGLWSAIIAAVETATTGIEVTTTVADITIPATVTDSFNRADVNPITGYSASGMAGNLTVGQIKSNKVTGATAGGWAVYDTTIGAIGDDQYAWITPSVLDAGSGGHAWIDMRITGEGSAATVDGYEVEIHRGNTPDNLIVWRTVNGAAVVKAQVAYPWTNGWSLGAAVIGATVYVLVNKNAGAGWETALTWTDPSPLAPGSSKIGFGGNVDNATTPTGGMIDEWSAGAFTRGTKSAVFTIAPAGALDWQQSVNLTSAFTIAPTGTLDATTIDAGQIGPLTSTYTIAPTGVREPVGVVSLTSTYTLSPAGQVDKLGVVSLTSAYTIAPTGVREALGVVVAITSTYTIAPTGVREPVGAAAITSTYVIAPTGVREPHGVVNLTSTFTIAPTGVAEEFGYVDSAEHLYDDFNHGAESPIATKWTGDAFNNLDDFAATDGSKLVKSGIRGTPWFSAYTSAVFGPDVSASARVSGHVELAVRLTNPGTGSVNGYFVDVSSGTWTLWKVTNNTQTQIGSSGSQALSPNDFVRLSMIGNVLVAYWSPDGSTWTQVVTTTDSTHTGAGRIAVIGNTSATFDDVSIGTLTPALRVAFSISAAGQVESDITGSASLSFAFSETATGQYEALGAAAITSTFTVAPTGTREARSTVNLPVAFTLTPAGHREALGAAALTSTYTIAPSGRREALGTAILTSTFVIEPNGSLDVLGAASATFTIDIAPSGETYVPDQYGQASLTLSFAISPTGTYERVPADVLFERIVTDPFRVLRHAPKPGASGFGPRGQGARTNLGGGRGGARK